MNKGYIILKAKAIVSNKTKEQKIGELMLPIKEDKAEMKENRGV